MCRRVAQNPKTRHGTGSTRDCRDGEKRGKNRRIQTRRRAHSAFVGNFCFAFIRLNRIPCCYYSFNFIFFSFQIVI